MAVVLMRDGATVEVNIDSALETTDIVDVRHIRAFQLYFDADIDVTVYECRMPEKDWPRDLTQIADTYWKESNLYGTAGVWTIIGGEFNAAPARACGSRLLKFTSDTQYTGTIVGK